MNTNAFHTINRRRSTFARSQTTQSAGGPVPIDGDKPLRSSSASSSTSSMVSTSSIGPLPNVICVQSSSQSPSVSSQSVDSGLQMRKRYGKDLDEEIKTSLFSVAAFLDCCDDSVEINTELLCKRNVGHIINVSPLPAASLIKRSTPCECIGEKKAHPVEELPINLTPTSSPREIVTFFSSVNNFIGKAREANSKVLIYSSQDRKNLGVVLAIEFLMWYYKIDVDRAVGHWHRMHQKEEDLPGNCMEALRIWMMKQNIAKPNTPDAELIHRRSNFASRRQGSEDSRIARQNRIHAFTP